MYDHDECYNLILERVEAGEIDDACRLLNDARQGQDVSRAQADTLASLIDALVKERNQEAEQQAQMRITSSGGDGA